MNHYTTSLDCLAVPKITDNLPSTKNDVSLWKFPQLL
jgi:hypothetical protein